MSANYFRRLSFVVEITSVIVVKNMDLLVSHAKVQEEALFIEGPNVTG